MDSGFFPICKRKTCFSMFDLYLVSVLGNHGRYNNTYIPAYLLRENWFTLFRKFFIFYLLFFFFYLYLLETLNIVWIALVSLLTEFCDYRLLSEVTVITWMAQHELKVKSSTLPPALVQKEKNEKTKNTELEHGF